MHCNELIVFARCKDELNTIITDTETN